MYSKCKLDSHADTTVAGSNCLALNYTGKECDVSPYRDDYDPISNVLGLNICGSFVIPIISLWEFCDSYHPIMSTKWPVYHGRIHLPWILCIWVEIHQPMPTISLRVTTLADIVDGNGLYFTQNSLRGICDDDLHIPWLWPTQNRPYDECWKNWEIVFRFIIANWSHL